MDNSTSKEKCFESLPTARELFHALELEQRAVLAVPMLFTALTLLVYTLNLRQAMRVSAKTTKCNVATLISIYPIVGVSSLISLLVPKSHLFLDSMSHICFVVVSYQFYRYCINCANGETRFIALAKEETFSFRAPPCCCCCVMLGRSAVTKQKFKILRFLALQFPIVHTLIMLTLNIIAIDSPHYVDAVFPYLGPFLLVTVLLGVWAFQITIRMISPYHEQLRLRGKFISFQLVLVFCKLQPLLIDRIVNSETLKAFGGCHASAHHVFVVSHAITQTLIQFEMLALSMWAFSLYKS